MIKDKQNELGFAAIEAILTSVIVAAIVGVGWYVYRARQASSSAYNTIANSSYPAKQVVKTNIATSIAIAHQQFLNIKEWGIRATYESSDTLSYTFAPGGNTIEIISKNLSTKYGCTTYGAGMIGRQSPTDNVDSGPITVEQDAKTYPSRYKLIAGYYYSFGHDQATCGSLTDPPLGQSVSEGVQAQQAANTFTSKLVPVLEAIP